MKTIALAGNPNSGKTALFNALTGSRQKVANYAGVTVEKKTGSLQLSRETVCILDLPGTYSLDSTSPDEIITREVLLGQRSQDSQKPDLILAVIDSTQLQRSIVFLLELKELEIPLIVALNMVDLAKASGFKINFDQLSHELQLPIVPIVAIRNEGITELKSLCEKYLSLQNIAKNAKPTSSPSTDAECALRTRNTEAQRIINSGVLKREKPRSKLLDQSDKIDKWVLHPVWGSILFIFLIMFIFQSVFSLASIPQDWIEKAITFLGTQIKIATPDGMFQSLLVDGIIAGVGSVVVFLPQIIILFFFILIMEDSGYMARAAFLLDNLMKKAGLNGRSFIPLLSSYACAIPGIMATRTIPSRTDRLVTILVAPLTTCSARLPVYTMLIAAFIPNTKVLGPVTLQGLVMIALYFSAILSVGILAYIFKKLLKSSEQSLFIMELPTYKWPGLKSLLLGLLLRSQVFLKRAGTVILFLSIIIWFLSSYPRPPEPNDEWKTSGKTAIEYSFAGRIGKFIEPVFAPIGFPWQVTVALIPGMAAREVMVSALSTVYAVEADSSGDEESLKNKLGSTLHTKWSLATALSLLAWYVFACQCLSTLAVVRRETDSWKWPLILLGYMSVLAYTASLAIFRFATFLGWG